MENAIVIDDLSFDSRRGNPVQFQGKHSGRILDGIDLKFTTTAPDGSNKVRALCSKDSVSVEDPFSKRKYEAKFTQKTESYQEGYPQRNYIVEIRELDLPPEFRELEINGKKYSVMKYKETDASEDAIGMHALLKMSRQEFVAFQESEDVQAEVKRVGVDESSVRLRYGGAMYWSEHKDGEETFYKQIVRFFPVDLPGSDIGLITNRDFQALGTLLLGTLFRLERLIRELHKSGAIDQEQLDTLLGSSASLLDLCRRREISWQFSMLPDAGDDALL